MTENRKIRVGISIGDVNGIGMEVALKSFSDQRILDICTPVFFASTRLLSFQKKNSQLNVSILGTNSVDGIVDGKINCINLWKSLIVVKYGEEIKENGKYAVDSMEAATEALKNGDIDVLITAPINKSTIQSEKFKFNGHTEFLGSKFEGQPLMFLVNDKLRVGVVTGHLPVSKVTENITIESIKAKANVMYQSLIQDFAITNPKIAVLSLNPHCGDNGLIGDEDDKIIKPAIEELFQEGMNVFGPYSADGFFGSNDFKKFDSVLAMYHDQGLIPFKTLSFGKGVNFTAGLDCVRTSPDHGTAYDIAGKNKADHSSFTEAIYMAINIFRNKKEYIQNKFNALKTTK